MNGIKISVVVPCFNVEKYIHRGLNSIIEQSLQEWEAILVDDGATDRTGEICDGYAEKDNRFQVVHTKNQGLPSARNTGMEYAHGELLYFMDPDDWIEKDCFRKCYEIFKQHDCEIVHFGLNKVYTNEVVEKSNVFKIYIGPEIWKEYTCQHVGFSQMALDGYYIGKDIWDLRKAGGVWCYMFKRTYILENNLRFPNVSMYEDGFFLVEATYKSQKLVSIPEVFYNYYIRNNGIVNSERSVEFIYNYKIKQVQITRQLRNMIKEFDLHDYYLGSHVLSCLKMALQFSKKYGNYKLYYKYVSTAEVQESIQKVSLKGAPVKFSIPVYLLKCHCPLLLFTCCWFLNKISNPKKYLNMSRM